MTSSNRRINQFFIDLIRALNAKQTKFVTRNFKESNNILEQLVAEQIICGFSNVNLAFTNVFLRYGSSGTHYLTKAEFYSRPGRKIFIRVKNLKKLEEWNQLNRVGFVRTRIGIITLKSCLEFKIGGELLILLK